MRRRFDVANAILPFWFSVGQINHLYGFVLDDLKIRQTVAPGMEGRAPEFANKYQAAQVLSCFITMSAIGSLPA
jgi:hypothetical protein